MPNSPIPIWSGAAGHSDGPCLLVHGGAWDIPDEALEDHRDGLTQAVQVGRTALESGQSALDAVVQVVASMERHGAFDAGRGSVLTRSGAVEMDAGVMDGLTLEYGAVAAVRRVPTPIETARLLMERGKGEVRILSGEVAEAFAAAQGQPVVDTDALIHPRERRRWRELRAARARYHTSDSFRNAPRGTVGCVARDATGRLAAATSTGGTPFRPDGRIGDSPLPGCGFYADVGGAASATGWGEAITAAGLSGRSVAALERSDEPEPAIRQELGRMATRVRNNRGEPATGGLILLSATGAGAWGYSTPRMARAGWNSGSLSWVLL